MRFVLQNLFKINCDDVQVDTNTECALYNSYCINVDPDANDNQIAKSDYLVFNNPIQI